MDKETSELIERVKTMPLDSADLIREVATFLLGSVPDGMNEMLVAKAYESAAIMLIPEGAFKKVATGSGTKRSFAQLIRHHAGPFGGIRRPSIYVTAATRANAICLAALKARLHTEGEGAHEA